MSRSPDLARAGGVVLRGCGQHGCHGDTVVVPPRPAAGDLPPVLDASAGGTDVLACFVLDPRLEASSGPRRLRFMCDSLRRLREDLDGRLFVTRGLPENRIPAIANEIDASAVHVSGISRRSGAGATSRCATPRATFRYGGRAHRIWCRRAGSPRTTAARTRSSRRPSTDGAGPAAGCPHS
jgi:hypothetical protein